MKTDNELIAEFMGYKLITPEMRRNPEGWSRGYWQKDYPEKQDVLCAEGHGMHYHDSWSWLMPVVEKIESLGFNFWIGKYASSVTKEGSGDPSFTVKGNSKLKVVYDAVTEFIKWYNENKGGEQ
jgi:ribosomal protein S18 acetylase RimI-like enzyme